MTASLQNLRLIQQQHFAVRKLTGFSRARGHSVPDRVTTTTEVFVESLVQDDVEKEVDFLFQSLKEQFHFKRREMTASAGGGAGSITTPHFTYEVRTRLNPDDPAEVITQRELYDIKDAELVCSPLFENVFHGKFDSLEFAVPKPLNIEQIVDQIEELEVNDVTVDYNKELTYCAIRVPGSGVRLEATPATFRITREKPLSIKLLIQAFLKTQELLVEKYQLRSLPF